MIGKKALTVAFIALICLFSPLAPAADSPAEALARKSGCFKCHALDKKKVAPSYRELAAKYKGDAKAQEKFFVHLTTHPMVEVDGEEEEHTGLKTEDADEIRSVIRWILSL